ncbi:MAG: phosphodiesterase [Candidatus Hydrogenedentes bacterium]|nr:phosphodiesterase [Candidatus Hydrogenedentota bacterium]
MLVGIISDTHGSLTAWTQAVNGPFAECDLIVHAGDVFYHGTRNPMPDGYDTLGLAESMMACSTRIVIARGNCDSEVDQMVLGIPISAPFAEVSCGGGTILVQHWQRGGQDEMKDIIERFRPRVFVTGHTHVPGLCVSGQTLIVNPGSPSLTNHPDGIRTVGRVRLDDDSRVHGEIVNVEINKVLEHVSLG